MKKNDKIFKKRLENILLEAGLINEEIAEHARGRQAETGDLIGDILVQEGYVTEEDVARELSRVLQLPFLSLDNYRVTKGAVDGLPRELLHRHQFVPVDRFGDTLSLAISQHLTLDAFKEIQDALKSDLTFFVALISRVQAALQEFAPMDMAEVRELRKQAAVAPKPSSWTDIFDTANKTVEKSLGPTERKKQDGEKPSAALNIFDTANTKIMKNLKKPPKE